MYIKHIHFTTENSRISSYFHLCFLPKKFVTILDIYNHSSSLRAALAGIMHTKYE
jgi:hypothetical protein